MKKFASYVALPLTIFGAWKWRSSRKNRNIATTS